MSLPVASTVVAAQSPVPETAPAWSMSSTPQLEASDGEPLELTLSAADSPHVRRRLQWDDTPQPAARDGEGCVLPNEVLVNRIRYIFEQKQAAQLDRLQRMLDRNVGNEEGFYSKLMAKFNLDESFFPPELTFSRLALVERIQYIFADKNPEHIDRLPQLLEKYAGKEGIFYSNLIRKYDLDESFFPAGQLPVEQLSPEVLKLRIQMIMEAHNPANVAKLPRLMSKWADNELALYQSLVKKHNVDESTFARASIPEGLPPLEPGTFAYIGTAGGDPHVVSKDEGEVFIIKGAITEATMVAAPGVMGWQQMHKAKRLLGLSEAFDTNDPEDLIGELTEQEAVEACVEMGLDVTPGQVTLTEMQAALRAHLTDMTSDPGAVFAELDKDNSGSLSHEEVRQAAAMLGFLMNKQQTADAFAQMDSDDSGKIDFNEFQTWFRVNVQDSFTELQYRVSGDTAGEGVEERSICVKEAELLLLRGEIDHHTMVSSQGCVDGWRPLGEVADKLGLSEALDVTGSAVAVDLIGELTEGEALEACAEMGVEVTPGVATLSEMQAALRAHFSKVKQNPRTGSRSAELEPEPEPEPELPDYVRTVRLFRVLPTAKQETVVSLMMPCKFNPGEIIFQEGDPGDAFYLVQSGRVVVTKGDATLVTLGQGEHFGELALIEDDVRKASVHSLDESTVLRLSKHAFEQNIVSDEVIDRTLEEFRDWSKVTEESPMHSSDPAVGLQGKILGGVELAKAMKTVGTAAKATRAQMGANAGSVAVVAWLKEDVVPVALAAAGGRVRLSDLDEVAQACGSEALLDRAVRMLKRERKITYDGRSWGDRAAVVVSWIAV